jgi:hypothetical protein
MGLGVRALLILGVDAEGLGVMRLVRECAHAAFFCNISFNVIEVISELIHGWDL